MPKVNSSNSRKAYWVFVIHDGYISFRSDSGFTGSRPFENIPGGKTPRAKAFAHAKWVGLRRNQFEVIDDREKENPTRRGITNRWGALLSVGDKVYVRNFRVGKQSGPPHTIAKIERTGAYAKAYGPRVAFVGGGMASIDDVTIYEKKNPRGRRRKPISGLTILESESLIALEKANLSPWSYGAVDCILYAVPKIANKAHAQDILLNLADYTQKQKEKKNPLRATHKRRTAARKPHNPRRARTKRIGINAGYRIDVLGFVMPGKWFNMGGASTEKRAKEVAQKIADRTGKKVRVTAL